MAPRWSFPTTAASPAARSSPLTTCCKRSMRPFPKIALRAFGYGSGSRTIAKVLGLFFENEFRPSRDHGHAVPHARTVFEIGGESSKYIRLEGSSIVDYDRSGECAAGTGSFLDQQALRMQYSVEEVGQVVCTASARLASRGAVRYSPRAT